MGADYIPEDNILSRVTPERTRKLREQFNKAEVPELVLNGKYLSYHVYEGMVIFSLPKCFHYLDPKLSCKVEQDIILPDNYFDMNAGEKQIKIISSKPEGLKLRSVYDSRKILGIGLCK